METQPEPSKKRGYDQYLEHDSESSPASQSLATARELPEPDNFCARCRSINFQEILHRKVGSYKDSFVMDLKSTPEELKASRCTLCQLFGIMSPSDFDRDGNKRDAHCHLRAFSANREFARLEPWELIEITDRVLLGVVRAKASEADTGQHNVFSRLQGGTGERGFLCPWQEAPVKSVLNVRLLDPRSLSLNFVRDCITYCSQNHGEACKEAGNAPTDSLQVIDCVTRTVVNAPPECQYVALSYVWGHSGTSPSSITLQNAPKLIDDSIDLTLKLGLQYLWVDRYCIDQSKKLEKHIQIRQMDLIYSRAHITVIAAAGQDPDHGLPGVRATPRSVQPGARIGDLTLVSTLAPSVWSTRNSKWASRGWTYQEFLLSKRRLVFTDQQTFYECNGMYCAESSILPLDLLHTRSKRVFRKDVPRRFLYSRTPGKKPWNIMTHIAEFNKRDLTFPEDAVDAMLGIFNSHKESPRPLRQLVGVPILPPFAALQNGRSYKPTGRSAEECFVVGLTWTHSSPSERRHQFPSWTWAGWYGKLREFLLLNAGSLCRLNTVKLWIEANGNKLVKFPTWDVLDRFLSQLRCQPKFIHIEASCMPISIVYLYQETVLANLKDRDCWTEDVPLEDGYWTDFQFGKDWTVYFKLHMDRTLPDIDSTLEARRRSWHGFVAIRIMDPSPDDDSISLVVRDMGSHAERLGVFSTNASSALECRNGKFAVLRPRERRHQILSGLQWTRTRVRLG